MSTKKNLIIKISEIQYSDFDFLLRVYILRTHQKEFSTMSKVCEHDLKMLIC